MKVTCNAKDWGSIPCWGIKIICPLKTTVEYVFSTKFLWEAMKQRRAHIHRLPITKLYIQVEGIKSVCSDVILVCLLVI